MYATIEQDTEKPCWNIIYMDGSFDTTPHNTMQEAIDAVDINPYN